MWFPADDGMVNLARVAYIEVDDGYEVRFYNDHRATLTTASFETEKQLHRYLDKLKEELPYPLEETEPERFPRSVSESLPAPGDSEEGGESA